MKSGPEKAPSVTPEFAAQILESAPDALVIVDQTGKIVLVNSRTEKLFGYPRQELAGQTVGVLVPEGFWRRQAGHRPEDSRGPDRREMDTSLELRGRRKDGTEFPVEISLSPIETADGMLVSGSIRDVSERKRAEAALVESEQQFRSVMEHSAIGFALVSLDGRWLRVNPALCHITGYAEDELLAIDFQTITHPDDLDADLAQVQRMLAGEIQTYKMEKRYFHKDGHTVRIVLNVSLVHGHDGRPRYFISQMQDITESKQSFDRLREQAALLDKTSAAIMVSDLEGRVQLWNKGAEHIYGWTAREVTGRAVTHLVNQNQDRFAEAWRAVIERGDWTGELPQVTKMGQLLTVEARWTLIRDDHGKPKSVLAINTDVSERKKLEAQFLRSQRMESIGTLAGGIAHDLNNVLAPILMGIPLLQERVSDDGSRHMLRTLEASAKRGADMIKQVLAFARGVEGQRMPIIPWHLIRDIERIMRETFPKSIRIETLAPRDLWSVLGDITQLHQVLLNLAVNARDAMPLGGLLTIGAENATLDENYAAMTPEARAGNYVVFQVADTGIGIPAEIRDKIFEPFFTTKEVGQGTGLGLSTTLAIVKSHDGFINFRSEAGRGSTFKVYLPAQPGGAEAAPAASGRLPRGNGELVLVVDDESSIRDTAQRTLERFGYRVLLASNGADAVALYAAHQHEVAVVLTDMLMPVMNGPATIVALTKINPAVRIIGASGTDTTGAAARAACEGVKHFLPKPYTAGAMLQALRATLAGSASPFSPP